MNLRLILGLMVCVALCTGMSGDCLPETDQPEIPCSKSLAAADDVSCAPPLGNTEDGTDQLAPGLPTDPQVLVDPVTPVETADPTEPAIPTNPTDPVIPANPTNPTDPTNPTNPTDPTNPVDPSGLSEVQFVGLLANLSNTLDRFAYLEIDYLRILLQIVATQTGANQFQVTTGTLVASSQGWLYEASPTDRLILRGSPFGDMEFVVGAFGGDNSTGASSFAGSHQVDFVVGLLGTPERLRVESVASSNDNGSITQRRLTGGVYGQLINSQFSPTVRVPPGVLLQIESVTYGDQMQFIGPLGDRARTDFEIAGNVRVGSATVALRRQRSLDRYNQVATDRQEADSSTGALGGVAYAFENMYVRRTLGLGLDELSTNYVAEGVMKRGGAVIGNVQFVAPPPQAGPQVAVVLVLTNGQAITLEMQ